MSRQADISSTRARRRRRWGKFLLAVGLLAVLFAGVIAAKRMAFLARAQSAPGVVIEMVRMSSGRISQQGGDAYAPRVRFVVAAGEREFVSPFGSFPPAFAVGDAVRVLYDPVDPDRAEVDSAGQLWGPVAVSGALGLLLMALGGWLVRTPRAAQTATGPKARG